MSGLKLRRGDAERLERMREQAARAGQAFDIAVDEEALTDVDDEGAGEPEHEHGLRQWESRCGYGAGCTVQHDGQLWRARSPGAEPGDRPGHSPQWERTDDPRDSDDDGPVIDRTIVLDPSARDRVSPPATARAGTAARGVARAASPPDKRGLTLPRGWRDLSRLLLGGVKEWAREEFATKRDVERIETKAGGGTGAELEARVAAIERRLSDDAHEAAAANFANLYRGVFVDGTSYARGACVTFGGSLWIATSATGSRPGRDSSWQLAVKHGRDRREPR